MIALHRILSRLEQAKVLFRVRTLGQLGVRTLYRTESPDPYYKGKAVFGKGRYYSLSKKDCEKIDSGAGKFITVEAPADMLVAVFDLTWFKDREQSNADWATIQELKGRGSKKVSGFVIYSNSMKYGYNQIVVFPHALSRLSKPTKEN